MLSIDSDLGSFISTLEKHQNIRCSSDGTWSVKGRLSTWADRFLKKEDPRLLNVFIDRLHKLEKIPVQFNPFELSIIGYWRSAPQKVDFSQWIKAAKVVAQNHRHCHSKKVLKTLKELKVEIVKLEYRVQKENGGRDRKRKWGQDHRSVKKLKTLVLEWKVKQPLYLPNQHKLTKEDLEKIDQMCAYPALIKRLLKDENQLDRFLKYAIRDNIGIDELAQFSRQIEDLHKSLMIGRIGAFSRKLLSVEVQNNQKVLNLLIENRRVNILDRSQMINFSDGTSMTLDTVFKDFFNKNFVPGKLEFFYEGIRPWNGHQWGNDSGVVDPQEERFWEKFPLFDLISAEKIEEKYQIRATNPDDWIGVIESSCQSTALDLDNAHGYMLFFIPEDENQYRVIPIGMFALNFPNTFWERFRFIADTKPGLPVFPDPNYYYSHRCKASYPIALTEEEGIMLLKEIGLKKREGGVFQWAWENCAFFAQNTFAKILKMEHEGGKVPELFKVHFSQCRPEGFLKAVHRCYVATPKILKRIYEYCLHILLGSWRSLTVIENGISVKKSSFNTPFGSHTFVNIPAAMHHRVKVVNYGHV